MTHVPLLRIRLLGDFELRVDDAAPALESARAEALLAWLLLHREAPQPRERIAFLLWPDSSEGQARTNLRHVLHHLRRALPQAERFLDITPRTLQWRPETPCWLDVAVFEAALARADSDADGGLVALREAVETYTGDLLEGRYDEWLLDERERLRLRFLGVLERLAALLEGRGENAQAVAQAERLLRHDPLREETYRLLMRLHDARGDRARALRVYHACTAALERELGVEPSPSTREVYETLLPGREPATGTPAERAGAPALIGRAAEWARLTSLWRAAERGQAQLVLISGEPGSGKTRLVEELRAWGAQRGALTAGARSYAAEGALSYGPVVAWLRAEPIRARLDRLDRARLGELARLLPELLSEHPDLAPPELLPESEQRGRLFDAVARAILAAGGPLLLVADDVQWCDRETLRFLHYLLRVAPEARLLVAATARSEELDEAHPLDELLAGLHALQRVTEIELGRLSEGETAALAEALTGRPLAQPAAERLFRETEGNPLFIVEALRAGWQHESADRALLTPRVHAVIESRLAQLSAPARGLAGVAATIGREFTTDVLAAAGDVDGDALVRALDELWRRRILREQGADAYDFSHDRICEVAYLALSPAQRRHRHLRVAQALERLHGGDAGAVAGQIAAHYEQAGAVELAVDWSARAAEAAQQLYANVEAARLLERAQDLLRSLPATSARQARELDLLGALPAVLLPLDGYWSVRLGAAHERALELARALGVELEPPLLRSLALAHLARDDFAGARPFGERLRARGERDGDDVLLVESGYVLGIAAFWAGDLEAARGHLEAAVRQYRPEHRGVYRLQYGHDPNVVCLMRLGLTYWFLGRPAAAARARDAALDLAEEQRHPYSRMLTLVFALLQSLELHDLDRLRRYLALLTSEPGAQDAGPAAHIQVVVDTFSGYLDVIDGRPRAGLARIRHALDDPHAAEQAPGQDAFLTRVLLEACLAAGNARTGLAAVERLLAPGGARLWDAEAHRLRAELQAASGASTADVKADLERALAIARAQGARTFELRAATSLLRYCLARHDGPGVASTRDLLAALVSTFPEPDDTHDLREAVALLSASS